MGEHQLDMSNLSPLEVVQTFEELFMKHRPHFEDVLPVVHEDIVIHEAPSVPYAGEHRGHAGWLALARSFSDTWEPTAPIECRFDAVGEDEVVARVKLDVIARPTGKPITLRIAEFHRVRDGKICETTIYYWDTAAMVEALTPSSDGSRVNL